MMYISNISCKIDVSLMPEDYPDDKVFFCSGNDFITSGMKPLWFHAWCDEVITWTNALDLHL